jgi:hypothetical protein
MTPFRSRFQYPLVAACLVIFATVATPALAQEHFDVVSVNTAGCNNGNFAMTVRRANLDGGTYTVRTRVQVGTQLFMNESASVSVVGESGWSVFDNFSYGLVPNRGTFPIDSTGNMRLDFTLERPKGIILSSWRLIVDSCATGNVLYSAGPILLDGFEDDGTSHWSATVS